MGLRLERRRTRGCLGSGLHRSEVLRRGETLVVDEVLRNVESIENSRNKTSAHREESLEIAAEGSDGSGSGKEGEHGVCTVRSALLLE